MLARHLQVTAGVPAVSAAVTPTVTLIELTPAPPLLYIKHLMLLYRFNASDIGNYWGKNLSYTSNSNGEKDGIFSSFHNEHKALPVTANPRDIARTAHQVRGAVTVRVCHCIASEIRKSS